MIAVFCALEEEIDGIRKRMQVRTNAELREIRVWKGKYGPEDNLLVLTGAGKEKVEQAAALVLAKYPLELAISAGFGGALNEKAQVGDIVVYSRVMAEGPKGRGIADRMELECDARVVSRAMGCRVIAPFKSICGIGVTTEGVCATTESKNSLGGQFGADSVDMESYWIGRAARAKGIPFLALRSIFDAVGEDVTFLDRITSECKRDYQKVIMKISLHPARLKELIHYYGNYRKASRSLTQFMGRLVDSIQGAKSWL